MIVLEIDGNKVRFAPEQEQEVRFFEEWIVGAQSGPFYIYHDKMSYPKWVLILVVDARVDVLNLAFMTGFSKNKTARLVAELNELLTYWKGTNA